MRRRPAFVAALILGCAVGDAAAAALVVRATCRDGEPNGGYELRTSAGRLRVLGAFHAGKPTGTFIFWNDAGGRLAAIPYDDGVRNGTVALWHVVGTPPREQGRRLELPLARGAPHGVVRTWHTNGQLRSEAEFAAGEPVKVAAWDASGRALSAADARRIVREDQRRHDAELVRLEELVSKHLPVCD